MGIEDFSIAIRFGAKPAYINESDVPLLGGRTWYVGNGYLVADGSKLIFHRLVIGAESDQIVDHKNGNTLDNRRLNLRICSHAENMRNRKMHKNNALRVKGVYVEIGKRAKGPRYVAQIRANGKKVVLGRFDTAEEASIAYQAAAEILHGEFARIE